ncbi:hypothetical protein A2U01_0016191, partial [Trifolium medium]|nr:hypothetical protein [Trifolium medium]
SSSGADHMKREKKSGQEAAFGTCAWRRDTWRAAPHKALKEILLRMSARGAGSIGARREIKTLLKDRFGYRRVAQ